MISKIIKHGLLYIFSLFLIGIFIQNSFANNYSEQEIILSQSGSQLESELVFEEQSFNAVAIKMDEIIEGLEINFGDGWEHVHVHDHGYGPEAIIFTPPTHTVEFRKKSLFSSEPIVLKSHIFYYEPEIAEFPDTSKLIADSSQMLAMNFSIISRAEWGANESLRYWDPDSDDSSSDDLGEKTSSDPCGDYASKFDSELGIAYVKEKSPSGEILTWPLQYMKNVRKIIIHHTDSEVRDMNGDSHTDSRDYKSMIRAIYLYHTITRGWGDIGYNYIIDPLGNVYEGRYGGDKVIGAHALCFNNGSIGIAVIGNYDENEVPEPAFQALVNLISLKTKQYSISPDGTSVFRGQKLANILGHRDVRATACPGKNLYDLLPAIRERSALALRSNSFKESNLVIENLDYNAEAVTDLSGLTLEPNERKTIKLKFKNTGKKSWDHNTWLHVALNNDPNARVIPILEDKVFVAADLIENSVSPGKVGTFEVEIESGYFAGFHSFEVAPVVNGRYKVSRSSVNIAFSINQPKMEYEVIESNLPKGLVYQGQNVEASIRLKNTGNITWRNYGENQITLGTSSPRDRKSIFIEDNPARIGYLAESEVAPGEVGTFVLNLDIPIGKTGKITEQFTPVIEHVGWLRDKALGFEVTIKEPIHLASIKKINPINSLLPGEMVKLEIQMQNKGDLTWTPDNMQTTLLGRGVQVFKNQLVPIEDVKPGKTADFNFWVQAPYEEGKHSIFLRSKFNKIPIRGGVARYVIDVQKPSLRAQMIDQPNSNMNLNPGQETELTVKFKNTGNVIWRNKGPNAVYLGSSNPRDRLSRLYYEDGWVNKYRPAVLNEVLVKPGETGSFTFKIKPEDKGVYNEGFQLVVENVGWVVGGNAKYVFRVFGDYIESSSTDLTDAEINKKRASVITKATNSTTTTKTTTSTTTSETETASATPAVTTITTTSVPSKTEDNPIRIKLSYSASSSKITSDKNFVIVDAGGNNMFNMAAGNEASISKIGNNIHVQVGSTSKSSSAVRFEPYTDGIMEIVSWEHRPTWNQNLNDNRFRGAIEVRVVNGQTAYINELPLEDYLKGLGEVSNSDNFEKQKVIAVLARSYARFYMKDENRKFPGLPYDGSDDPDVFQKYLGYGLEARSPNFVGAVAITKDEVVTYNGELVKTPYFNQSDGRTRSAQEVWGWTNTPYLQSVSDPWCTGLTKNGHGVGLSGYGATKQAEEGKTYDEIIKYYYQGVEIQEIDFE